MRTNFDFVVSIVAVIVIRPISIYRWVDAYPTELLDIDDETDSTYAPSWQIDDILNREDDNDNAMRRVEALENLQKIFGIRGQIENKSTRNKIPPQFMMELYNTIADSSGITRGKNPYNAKVVRSFIERDTPFSHLYLFNISGLEINESVLEAELHLYRRRTSLKSSHPSVLTSPYYLIRVYQVLDGKNMNEPDLHRLLNVHYVGAHASGWQVFNVKQAVLAWVSGAPNLGLMVTASNLFDDEVEVEFSRRNDYHNSKQPILVLFDDDGKGQASGSEKKVSHYYSYEKEPEDTDPRENVEEKIVERPSSTNDNDDFRGKMTNRDSRDQKKSADRRRKELNDEHVYETQLNNEKSWQNDERKLFQRQKRLKKDARRQERKSLLDYEDYGANNERIEEKSHDFMRGKREAIEEDRYGERKDSRKFVTERRRGASEILTSMDIYERAMFREEMTAKVRKIGKEKRKDGAGDREKRSLLIDDEKINDRGEDRSSKSKINTTECSRHELYVDFEEIGLSSSIIAPKGYSAYHCQGICDSPLSQDQQPTNHATVQGIVHKMGLVANVHMPCCVPTKLVSTTILFFDGNENVVLKVYEDMIADRCGCR